jgi:hypothetical protein
MKDEDDSHGGIEDHQQTAMRVEHQDEGEEEVAAEEVVSDVEGAGDGACEWDSNSNVDMMVRED